MQREQCKQAGPLTLPNGQPYTVHLNYWQTFFGRVLKLAPAVHP